MKTTLELPDDLVTEIKIEAARRKKKLKELVPQLLRAGLDSRRNEEAPDAASMRRWLREWTDLGRAATGHLASSPTATEILAADRNRLERS